MARPANGSPFGATATTAASGGNREELLGQRPAGCKRQRSRRWEPQPGLGERSETERASPSPESRRTAISRFFERAKLCPNFSIHAGKRAIRAGFIDFFPQMRYIQSNPIFYGFTISFHHSKEVFVCCLIVSLRCVFWVAPSIRGGGYRFTPSGLSAGSSACPYRCPADRGGLPRLCRYLLY